MGFVFALLFMLALVAAVIFAIFLGVAFLRKRPTKIWLVRLGLSAAVVVVGVIGTLISPGPATSTARAQATAVPPKEAAFQLELERVLGHKPMPKLSKPTEQDFALTRKECAAADAVDHAARHAPDSEEDAQALEGAAHAWEKCARSLAAVQARYPNFFHNRSDYDFFGATGVFPHQPLVNEASAFNSAGTEWELYGKWDNARRNLEAAHSIGKALWSSDREAANDIMNGSRDELKSVAAHQAANP